MANVEDEQLARSSNSCFGFEADGKQFLWHPGVIGPMDQSQIDTFCNKDALSLKTLDTPTPLRIHQQKFGHNMTSCSVTIRGIKDKDGKFLYPRGKRLEPIRRCLRASFGKVEEKEV